MTDLTQKRILYVYLDEGGNLDFSKKGTPFYLLTSVTCVGEPGWAACFRELLQELIAAGINISHFHASEDQQSVRDRVFRLIGLHAAQIDIDSLVVEKAKTGPRLQEPVQFYSRMIGYLFKYTLKNYDHTKIGRVVIVTDRLPAVKKSRSVLEKAIKEELARLRFLIPYEIRHERSAEHPCLQIADYCNWAIFRKWTKGDARSYDLIKHRIKSEFDIFRTGSRLYY